MCRFLTWQHCGGHGAAGLRLRFEHIAGHAVAVSAQCMPYAHCRYPRSGLTTARNTPSHPCQARAKATPSGWEWHSKLSSAQHVAAAVSGSRAQPHRTSRIIRTYVI